MDPLNVRRFLEDLDARGVPYVSWKNNQEVTLALDGHSDLDIYVPATCERDLRQAAAG